jgi:gliding motility-associated-like protein
LHLTINNGTFTSNTQSACESYVWNGTNYSQSGTYIHSYVSSNGCPSADTLHLTINNATHNVTNTSTCETFVWNGITYTQSGSFVHNYINQWGCSSADTLHLNIYQPTTSQTTTNVCSASLPYLWNGQSLTSSGIFNAHLVNSNGCDSTATLNLVVTTTPPAPQATPQIGYCQFDQSAAITATGTYPLLWYTTAAGGTGSSSNPIPNTSVAGVQHYYVSQTNGSCESPRTHITVRVSRKPVLGPDKNLKICYGTGADLTDQFNYIDWQAQWTLNNVPISNPGNVVISGSYQLIVTTPAGCSDTALVTVSVMPPVVANAGPDANAVYNQPHQLHGAGGGTYTWTPGSAMNNSHIANPLVTLTDDTYFVLTVQDAIGCTDTDTVLIKVYRGPSFYIPNAFTPNGDGLNDDFKPTYVGIERLDYFRIFDRYGVLVYETHDMGAAWNGTYKGRMQNTGNFVYIVKGMDKNGQEKILKGNVLLIH